VSPVLLAPVGTLLAWLLTQATPIVPPPQVAPIVPPPQGAPIVSSPQGVPIVPSPRPAPIVPPPPPATVVPVFVPAVRPHIRAERTPTRPKIDGKLDDAVWQLAPPSSTFTQHFPNEGAPPSERTTLRVLYDDQAIYIGLDCEQVHSPVVKRLMRRDTQLPSDSIWVDIDSRRDGVSAFHFGVNAAGVLSDAIHFNDLDYSSDWDAVWQGRAADTPRGYSVEMRIPFYVLRFEALPLQDWGLEVRRFIEARQEYDDWSFYPRSAGSYVPLFGRIDNLANLSPKRSWQLLPFELGRVRHRAEGANQNVLAHGWDGKVSGGIDAKIALTNEMTLDLSVLPDFGQVEADAVVLNLSTYETLFPEKRPFFLEGIDVFSTVRQFLYTRRIGHQPSAPTLNAGETLVDSAEPSPIYGAAKIVGTIGSRTTLGLLSAVTGRNDVDVRLAQPLLRGASGPVQVRTVEPISTFNVLRLKRLVGDDSTVGLLATAVNRFEPLHFPGQFCPVSQQLPATDSRCTNDAYAAGVDGRWRSPGGDYVFTGQALGTALMHGPPRIEPDGIYAQPGHVAGGASLDFDKVGGQHWLWSIDNQISGRQLEYNDLGYLDRKNDYLGAFSLQYRTISPWWKTLETRTMLLGDYRTTLDGIGLPRGTALQTYWTLSNYWAIVAQGDLRGSYHDDREVRMGGEITLVGDPRRRLGWSIFAQYMYMENARHWEAHGGLTWRAKPQLELEIDPTVSYDEGEPRYVQTYSKMPSEGGPATYFFGIQEARSLGATLRGSYTFTPELSLQVYTQAFLARVHYPRFLLGQVTGPRQEIDIASLRPTSQTPSTAVDSLTSTLNVNVVLRWEFRLGSTMFLVYTRAQTPPLTPSGNGATSLDLRPILNGSAATDVLMLKVAYWFGFG
jgi:hypothetical protein